MTIVWKVLYDKNCLRTKKYFWNISKSEQNKKITTDANVSLKLLEQKMSNNNMWNEIKEQQQEIFYWILFQKNAQLKKILQDFKIKWNKNEKNFNL